ncbi:hypothetical protein [Nitrospira sp. M1]
MARPVPMIEIADWLTKNPKSIGAYREKTVLMTDMIHHFASGGATLAIAARYVYEQNQNQAEMKGKMIKNRNTRYCFNLIKII